MIEVAPENRTLADDLSIRDGGHAWRLSQDEERALHERYLAGDREAGELLLRSVGAWVFKLSHRYRSVARQLRIEVDEMAQIGIMSLWKGLPTFDPSRARLTTWATLRLRATFHAADQRKRGDALRHSVFTEEMNGFVSPVNTDSDVVADAARSDDAEWLRAGLKRLDPRTAKIFRLRMQGRTLTEIGDEIGVTRERVRQIEQRGMDRLRRILEPRGRGRHADPATSGPRSDRRRSAPGMATGSEARNQRQNEPTGRTSTHRE